MVIYVINQYSADEGAGQYQTEDAGAEIDKKKVLFLVGGLAVVIVLIVAIFSFMGGDSGDNGPSGDNPPVDPKIVCGDGKCDKTENCADCVKDCGCKADEECSFEKKCVEKEIEPEGPECGDGVCDASENCFDCKDCRCGTGMRCSPTEKICVKPVCGDGRCESPEEPYTCCIDCFCTNPSEECNTDTKKCELIELSLSEERARELIESHYESEGKTVVSMNARGPWKWDDVPILLFEVTIDGQEWPSKVGVYEDERVEELPAM